MQWRPRRLMPLWGVAMMVALVFAALPIGTAGQAPATAAKGQITFAKDIAPILQQKCQGCHHPGAVAPMSFLTYEEVRPWARSIKLRTGLGSKPDVMPPWFVDKSIGIQRFQDDMSLSDVEITKVSAWVDAGAPLGSPADMPSPRTFGDNTKWRLGKPDLIVASPSIEMAPTTPDWYGAMGSAPTGLTEDRYAEWVEVREITDSVEAVDPGRRTIGGQYIMHHLAWSPVAPKATDTIQRSRETRETPVDYWPTHEVGRNPDVFDAEAGKLVPAGSKLVFSNVHLHANGKRTKAHVEVGFKFHPKGYKPTKQFVEILTSARDLDLQGLTANQKFEGFTVLSKNTKIMNFEPHMHAAGVRMCLDAIWGQTTQTLSCVGYNHGWVRTYTFEEGVQPLLPKGTILRMSAYFDTTPANRNVTDGRNWQGLGNRSIDNMAVSITNGIYLTDEELDKEMAQRRQASRLTQGETIIGCPLCWVQKPVSVASR